MAASIDLVPSDLFLEGRASVAHEAVVRALAEADLVAAVASGPVADRLGPSLAEAVVLVVRQKLSTKVDLEFYKAASALEYAEASLEQPP